MSKIHKKQLGIGIFLMVTFIAVMVVIFMPIFGGGNALNYLDNLYNSISKGSAYYIPKVEHQVEEHGSQQVTLNLKMTDSSAAQSAEPLFARVGATTAVQGNTLMVNGDLEAIFSGCLEDAESAYRNRGDELTARYGRGRPDHPPHLVAGPRRDGEGPQPAEALPRRAADPHGAGQDRRVRLQLLRHRGAGDQGPLGHGAVLAPVLRALHRLVRLRIMYTFEGLGFSLTAH